MVLTVPRLCYACHNEFAAKRVIWLPGGAASAGAFRRPTGIENPGFQVGDSRPYRAAMGKHAILFTSVGRPRTLSLTYGDWVIAYLHCGKVSPRRGRYKLDNLYQPFPYRKIAPKIIRPTRDRKTGIRYNRGNRKSTLQATARKGTR